MAGRRWRRDVAKERRWRRVLREWRQSGLSVREFCDWQALSEPSFYAWRRELAKRDRESPSDGAGTPNGRIRPTKSAIVCPMAPTTAAGVRPTKAPGPFLPVEVVADGGPDSGARGCLEVQLPSGVRLRVPGGFDRQTLADVLTALEARAC